MFPHPRDLTSFSPALSTATERKIRFVSHWTDPLITALGNRGPQHIASPSCSLETSVGENTIQLCCWCLPRPQAPLICVLKVDQFSSSRWKQTSVLLLWWPPLSVSHHLLSLNMNGCFCCTWMFCCDRTVRVFESGWRPLLEAWETWRMFHCSIVSLQRKGC